MTFSSEPSSDADPRTVGIGGIAVSLREIGEAIALLEDDHSTSVKQPLRYRSNPLWESDYHSVAADFRSNHPELEMEGGTPEHHAAHVKTAFVRYLKEVLSTLGQDRTATENVAPFAPAYADRYCSRCGFPFRGRDRSRDQCHVPGACADRREMARTEDGLRERLRRTRELDPSAERSSKYAVAHAWVRQHFPEMDLTEWEPHHTIHPGVSDQAANQSGPSRPEQALPAEAREPAEGLLRRLLGVPLTTISGSPNLILAVSPPTVLVSTERSPQGQPVLIAALEQGLALLRRDGKVMIAPDVLGHRSSFIGAVLRTLPGAAVSGSPPVLSITAAESTEQEHRNADMEITFEGDLGRGRTIQERQEQATLRRILFKGAGAAVCALCGETYPVRFLWAAHIKKRSLCAEHEQRDLSHIAMAACVFGCDALFETGFITVSDQGTIIGASHADGTVGRRIQDLHGRLCHAHSPQSASYFRWHHDHVFRN